MSVKQKRILILSAVIAAVLAVAAGAAVYLFDYYPADNEAMQEAYPGYGAVVEYGDSLRAYEPAGEIKYGLIFYPGAKIEYTAYEPLMNYLADRGVLCLLVKMPFNLAIFGKDSAVGLNAIYPEVEHWYIGGHSLGGAMAADFAYEYGGIEGVVLLAAYPSKSLSETGLRVLSIYGSNDGVMNKSKYEKSKAKLPADFTEQVIEGGNHAGFGFYGEQQGDGEAQISAAEQSYMTAIYIADFILGADTESTAVPGSEESFES